MFQDITGRLFEHVTPGFPCRNLGNYCSRTVTDLHKGGILFLIISWINIPVVTWRFSCFYSASYIPNFNWAKIYSQYSSWQTTWTMNGKHILIVCTILLHTDLIRSKSTFFTAWKSYSYWHWYWSCFQILISIFQGEGCFFSEAGCVSTVDILNVTFYQMCLERLAFMS